MDTNERQMTFSEWGRKYPWHVSGPQQAKYPTDQSGNCACNCDWCRQVGEHLSTMKAHWGEWEGG